MVDAKSGFTEFMNLAAASSKCYLQNWSPRMGTGHPILHGRLSRQNRDARGDVLMCCAKSTVLKSERNCRENLSEAAGKH